MLAPRPAGGPTAARTVARATPTGSARAVPRVRGAGHATHTPMQATPTPMPRAAALPEADTAAPGSRARAPATRAARPMPAHPIRSTTPPAAACRLPTSAPASPATSDGDTIGTTTAFASGAASETMLKVGIVTGSVTAWAIRVRPTTRRNPRVPAADATDAQ